MSASPPIAGTEVFVANDDDRVRTFLVSDLHVPPAGGKVLADLQALTARVRAFGPTARLVILGDLFEAVVNERQLGGGRWPELLADLRATAAAGVSVSVLHGNRDFMLGRGFARATGARVVPGGLALDLDGARTLLLHGDELCTNDVPYQRSKRWLRCAAVRGLCRSLPRRWADAVARKARGASMASTGQGDPERFRPVGIAVASAFAAGFAGLVFGHVHTPGQGAWEGGRYWVLPAFDATPVYLEHARGGPLEFRHLGAGAAPTFGPLAFAPAR